MMQQQVIWTLLVRGLLILAGAISSIITARALGSEGRGIFFYWFTLVMLLIQFGNLGLHSSNTYYLIKKQIRLSTLATNSLWVSLAGGLALASGLLIVIWFCSSNPEEVVPFILPVLLMVPAGLYFLLGTNLLIALDRIGEYNGFELANRYIGLAALLFAVWLWQTPESLMTAIALSSVLICFLLFSKIHLSGSSGYPDLKVFIDGLGYALRAYLSSMLGFFVLRLNVIILERYADAATFGVWSIAMQLFEMIIILPGTIALLLLPELMRIREPYRVMQFHLLVVLIILTITCAVFALFGQELVKLLYGEEFVQAYNMLMWATPGIIGLGLISIVAQYLAVMEIPMALIWIWVLGFLVEVALSFWLIPEYMGKGAMLSLSVSYLLILTCLMILARQKYRANREIVNEKTSKIEA